VATDCQHLQDNEGRRIGTERQPGISAAECFGRDAQADIGDQEKNSDDCFADERGCELSGC